MGCSQFFSDAPKGINCKSGFITFGKDGTPTSQPHSPIHKQRHCLASSWHPGAKWDDAHLLTTFLNGCFGQDPDGAVKIRLVAEVCGVAALGNGTSLPEPKAVVLYGQSAANGKSEMLAMIEGLLPDGAVCSIPPTRFSDERMMIDLVGCQLNACAELGAARVIAADVFKSVVTGDQVLGKQIYQPAVYFRPSALHIFATNSLPPFHGGIDRGVQRRLLLLTFNHSIAASERIARIGSRIAAEEQDALLAFAVEGASRVMAAGRFSIPASSHETLRAWVFDGDPVFAWKEICTEYDLGEKTPVKALYAAFTAWATEEGIAAPRLAAINNFAAKLKSYDGRLTTSRTSSERFIENISLKCREGDADA